jgi:integrase
MASVRVLDGKNTLFLDFRFQGIRCREYTVLTDNVSNRKRLKKVLETIVSEIEAGTFNYQKTFGKPLPESTESPKRSVTTSSNAISSGQELMGERKHEMTFKEFAEQWYCETEIAWRRSYKITQRGVIDKYLIPKFGEKSMMEISKSDLLAFRADLTKLPGRGASSAMSARRVNAVMKPLRQILNEGADRYGFTSPFKNIKPMKIKRADVMPLNLEEVQKIFDACRPDFRNYFTVRFFTGLRTGEVHGLKWKHVDLNRRLIYVRESIVLGEEDELKTDGSARDVQMSQIVHDALKSQKSATQGVSEFVFCNREGKPLDNKNFINRVWAPLLRNLGLQHRKAYQMRHTAATLWLSAGEAPEWIARQLGHSSTEMLFRVYSRYVPNLTRNDGSAMDRLLTHAFIGTNQQTRDQPGTRFDDLDLSKLITKSPSQKDTAHLSKTPGQLANSSGFPGLNDARDHVARESEQPVPDLHFPVLDYSGEEAPKSN